MASKKKRKPNGIAGPVKNSDGELFLSKQDLYNLELANALVREMQQEVDHHRSHKAQLEAQHALQMHDMQDRISVAQLSLAVRGKHVLTVRNKLSEVYDLDFSEVVYDDESGKINLGD